MLILSAVTNWTHFQFPLIQSSEQLIFVQKKKSIKIIQESSSVWPRHKNQEEKHIQLNTFHNMNLAEDPLQHIP